MSRNNIIYGDKHTFTSYSNQEVILQGGVGQQLTIQGSLNIIDKYNDSAGITFNGAPINVSTNSALYLNDLSDVQVSTSATYLQHLVITAGANWVNSNWTAGLNFLATTGYDFGIENQDYVWRDLLGDPVARGGASEPDYTEITGSGGFYSYEFGHSGTAKYLYFTFHVPHDYKAGSDVYFHVHYTNAWTTNTSTGNVRFAILTSIFPSNSASKITYNYNTVYPETKNFSALENGKAIIAETADAYMGGDIRVDDLILCRLTRDNTVGSNYAEKIWVQLVDIHYQSNKNGTKDKVAPFYS